MDQRTNSLQDAFTSVLNDTPLPQEPPREWRIGQHQYFRVEEAVEPYPDENYSESNLSVALDEFARRGITVLDFGRVAYFRDDVRLIDWVFKTMAPREVEAT